MIYSIKRRRGPSNLHYKKVKAKANALGQNQASPKEERGVQLDMNDSGWAHLDTHLLACPFFFDLRVVEVAVLCSAGIKSSSRECVLLWDALFEKDGQAELGCMKGKSGGVSGVSFDSWGTR